MTETNVQKAPLQPNVVLQAQVQVVEDQQLVSNFLMLPAANLCDTSLCHSLVRQLIFQQTSHVAENVLTLN
jgi:hypothetical protein